MARYAENMWQGQVIRSELSTVLTRNHMRWRDVDQAILPLTQALSAAAPSAGV